MANVLEARFRTIKDTDSGEVTFDPEMLRLFLAIDESKTLLDLARELQMPPAVFKTSLLKLIEFKLIEPVEGTNHLADASVLNEIHDRLIEFMGPMGVLLIEEAARELSLEPTKIPRARIQEFIAHIAKKIPGSRQQVDFTAALEHFTKAN
jgi:hypothetical protein